MKKFWVSGILTVSFCQTVEAETLDEAKELVKKMSGVDLDWDSEDTEITDGEELQE